LLPYFFFLTDRHLSKTESELFLNLSIFLGGVYFISFFFFRIKRDIEQILKELLPTNDTNDPTIPDKDGKFNPLWPGIIVQNLFNGLHTVH